MSVQIVKLLDNPVQINLTNGPNFKGEYVNVTTYSVGDSVSYVGSSYVAVQSTVGNLPTNTVYWQVIAEKGNTGATGATGSFSEPTKIEISFDEAYSSNYKEFTYTTGKLTQIKIYDTPLKVVTVFTKSFTYTGDNLTQITLTHNVTGSFMTKTLAYSGSNLTSITTVYTP